MILNKKQMSEEDIKLQFIMPAITSKWDIRKITMETPITDGRVLIGGNLVTRSAPKRADHLLYESMRFKNAFVNERRNTYVRKNVSV